jgi:hypothetical protein
MMMKHGGYRTATIRAADGTLMSSLQPEAKSSSATSTAKAAPTAQSMIPKLSPFCSKP